MSDYISREALIGKVEKHYCAPCKGQGGDLDGNWCRACVINSVLEKVRGIPAADVAPVTTLNELTKEIHDNAVSHGWWDEPRNLLEIAALCHSELSESVEEYRAGRPMVWANEDGKPEGIATEMADCLIRILDWFGHEGLDADEIVRQKMAYNRGRPYKHGKRC